MRTLPNHFADSYCTVIFFVFLLQAKLAFVPMYPEAVLGLTFLGVIAISVALQENSLLISNFI